MNRGDAAAATPRIVRGDGVGRRYLRELADLRDGSRYASALGEALERVGLRPVDVRQVVTAPRTLAATSKAVTRLETGDLKLRVRSVELEAQLQRVETRQRLYGAAAAAVLLANSALLPTAAAAAGARAAAAALLRKATAAGAAWAALEAFGAYCQLAKAEKNRKRFNNELGDV